jgi:hypothetical protein
MTVITWAIRNLLRKWALFGSVGKNFVFLYMIYIYILYEVNLFEHKNTAKKNAETLSLSFCLSDTAFYFHLQVKTTQLGPIDRASPHLRTSIDWAQLSRF